MKKLFPMTLICLLFLAGTASAEEPVVLKFGIHDPPHANVMVGAYIPWVENINKAAQGSIRVDLYPSATLGRDPTTYLKLLKDGVMDIAHLNLAHYPGRFPDDDVFGIPMMAENGEECSLASWNMYIRGLLRGYDDLRMLSKSTTDVRRIHSTYPIRTPKDLKGRKFAVNAKFLVDFFKSLGAIPISIPIQNVAENFARGVIDGVLCDTNALYVFRINEVATYYLKKPPLGCLAIGEAMMQDKFDSLPRRGKLALEMYRGRPLLLPLSNVMWGESEKCLADAEKDPKATVYTPTPEEMKEWEKAIQAVVDDWKKEYPKGEMLIKAFQRELDWIRAGGFGIAQ